MGIEPCCLERWIADRTGLAPLTMDGLRAYQLERIRQAFTFARARAPFYRDWFEHMQEVRNFSEFARLPVLGAGELMQNGTRMLCVEQEQICRIFTSGTTAAPKRLYFTAAELDATVDYFAAGSRQFLHSGDTALLLFDCDSENGAGRLFLRALGRMRVAAVAFGVPADGYAACDAVRRYAPALVLAAPETARAMVACGESARFDTLLLSGGATAADERTLFYTRFGCDVFEQYGLTETAFGLGVDCRAFMGYHLREADYYVEILDENGSVLPDGEWGRVVVTSLHCGALPLIRYDTGDRSRYVPGGCGCKSALPLLDRVLPRAVPKGYHRENGA